MILKSKLAIAAIALSAPFVNAATFVMEKQNTSFAIDGNNGAIQNQQVYLWNTNTNNANQNWDQLDRGNGYYSYRKQNTNMCLDGGNGGARRQPVKLWPCQSSNQNQHWKKVKVYNGTEIYRMEKRNAPGFSIDGNGGAERRQAIYLWDSNSNNVNQQWDFIRTDTGSSSSSSSSGSTSSSGSSSSSSGGGGAIDLSQWKLTLPVSKSSYFGSGGSSAAEILPGNGCNSDSSIDPLDDGFRDYSYFYADNGDLVFITPLLGGGSTPSSSYVRSELRELYDWSPCGDDGAANWSPNGKHVLSGTLRVTDYYSSDPQTIVGQIHAKDSSKALLKLQWDGPNKDVRAIVNEDPSSGNPFSLDFGLIPGTDEWSYVITLEDGKMTVAVTYDGDTVTKSVTFGQGDMSSSWNNHVYYFKAGNYAQADKDSGGNFEVRFSDLNVSHSN